MVMKGIESWKDYVYYGYANHHHSMNLVRIEGAFLYYLLKIKRSVTCVYVQPVDVEIC